MQRKSERRRRGAGDLASRAKPVGNCGKSVLRGRSLRISTLLLSYATHMHIGQAYLRTARVSCTSVLRISQRAHESTHRRIPFARYELPTWRTSPRPLPVWKPWPGASVAVLEQLLAWIARNKPSITTAERLLRYMIDERHVQPTTAHYEAMILANRDPDGSIGNVKAILSEMEDHGLQTSGLIDNAVLEVKLHASNIEGDADECPGFGCSSRLVLALAHDPKDGKRMDSALCRRLL